PPENLMRKPLELDWSPARSRSTPAFINSSLYLPIAERSSSLGMMPASESLLAFTIIMNLMVNLSFNCYVNKWLPYLAPRTGPSRNGVTVDASAGDEEMV